MAGQISEPPSDVESRLIALENSVARLISMVEPGFAVANIAAPVALPLLKEAAQHESGAKFFALLDVGESLIKYSAAIAFASAMRTQGTRSQEILNLFQQPPSLGKLAEGLRTILDDSEITEWPVEILRTAFRKPNKSLTSASRYLFDEFISLRNKERGHGAQQPEGHYESLYLKNYLIIQDTIRACTFLQLPLVHVHAVDHTEERYSYRVTILMGATTTRFAETIETTIKVKTGSTCLWDRGVHLLPLTQFVSFQYCETCRLEHVFLAEQITLEDIRYHAYLGNHRSIVRRAAK
jgi:hypothetical protein